MEKKSSERLMRVFAIFLFLAVSMQSFAQYIDCSNVEKYNVINDPQLSLLLNKVESQNIDLKIAKKSMYKVALELVSAEVALNYIALRKTQRLTDLSKNLELNQERRHKLFEAQYYQGPGTSVEVNLAESKIANAQAAVISLEAQAKKYIYRLSVLIGECPDALLEELSCPSFISLIPNEICDEEICQACGCTPKKCGGSLLYRKAELTLLEKLFSAYESYCSELERNDLLQKSVEAAQNAVKNANNLFLGGGNLSVLLNAEQALTEAQIALIENEAELASKAVVIEGVLGECYCR